jgi:hypothetical protein
MDALIILLVAVFIRIMHRGETEDVESVKTENYEKRLNPDFYEDRNAFMVFANELGFGERQ